MKKIIVSDKCVACGSCTQMTDLIIESPNGKAQPAITGDIPNDKLDNFEEIINICPARAIKIEESGISSKEGKVGLIELKKYITDRIKEYKIVQPNSSSYRCDIRKSAITYNSPSGQNRYDYSSNSKAEDAGLREFDRAMYSQRKALVQEYLSQFKTNVLKPYSCYEKNADNYYYNINKYLTELLTSLINEISEKSRGEIWFDSTFAQIDAYSDINSDNSSNSFHPYRLRNIDGILSGDIANRVDSLYQYKVYVNTNDMEDYKGRDTYSYDLVEVIDELRSDLASATNDIVNDFLDAEMHHIFDTYQKCLTEVLVTKANTLIKEIESFCK